MASSVVRLVIVSIAVLVLITWAALNVIQTQVERRDAVAARVFDMSKEYRNQLGPIDVQFSYDWNNYLTETVDSYNGGQLDEKSYSDLVDRFLANGNNNNNFVALSAFYEEIGECVDADLCDFWAARALFGADIVTFYHNMYPALQREHQEGTSVDGILSFVERMKDADHGAAHRRFEFRFLRSNPDQASAS